MMELGELLQSLGLALLALIVATEGANFVKLDCSSTRPSCESEEDYTRCLEPEDRWRPAQLSRAGCYCVDGLPRSCADLCDNSSREDSGVECRRRCFEYSACLDAQWVADPSVGVVANGPPTPLPSRLTAARPEILVGSQPPGAGPHLSHLESGSSTESSVARDGDIKAFVLNALQQWWPHILLAIIFVALIVYGIVKMRYCHDDSRRDTGKHPPKEISVFSAWNSSGDFAYRPLAP